MVAQVLELPARQGSQRWASLEPKLDGAYDKFNNNAGAVLGGSVAQAFSHFTVHESGGQICICDLQGVGKTLFTDPQIHAKGGGFGDGNLGSGGISSFLSTHRCNDICKACGLPPVEPKPRGSGGNGNGMMMVPGGGGGAMPFDLNGMMRGGMGATAGMPHGMGGALQKIMQQMMGGQMAGLNLGVGGGGGGGGVQRVFINGREVDPKQLGGARGDGHGGGHDGGRGRGDHRMVGGGRGHAGDDELHAALRASNQQAAVEDDRRLREALAASGGRQMPPARGGGGRAGCGGLQPAGAGVGASPDLDLQRALMNSHHQPQPRRR